MNNNSKILCPICGFESKKTKQLDSEFIKNKLSERFNLQITNELKIINYNMMKCMDCDFEFGYPLIDGSNSFYEWITSQPNYYPNNRWEHSKVIELITKDNKSIDLLDVGCGDGKFFDQIVQTKNTNINFYGIDTSINSIQICKNKGYEAYCGEIHNFKAENENTLFDYVVSYHCLEHIANSKEFIQQLARLITPQGAIFISTPYSPMDFEIDWYDVLNYPPHHMGRWNLKSYKKVAEVLGLNIEVFMPKPQILYKSIFQSFLYSIYGNEFNISKIKILSTMCLHPLKFINHLYFQIIRERINDARASNVILIKLTNK